VDAKAVLDGVGLGRGKATTRRIWTLALAQLILSLYLAQPNSPLTHLKKTKIWATSTFSHTQHKNS